MARNALQGVGEIGRIDRRVADIGAVGQFERRQIMDAVEAPDDRRLVADLAGAVARACAVGHSLIEWHADDTDIQVLRAWIVQRYVRQSHESCDAGKARPRIDAKRLKSIGHGGDPERLREPLSKLTALRLPMSRLGQTAAHHRQNCLSATGSTRIVPWPHTC